MPSKVNGLPRSAMEVTKVVWLAGVRYETPLPSRTSSKAPTSALWASSSQEVLVWEDAMFGSWLSVMVVEGCQSSRCGLSRGV